MAFAATRAIFDRDFRSGASRFVQTITIMLTLVAWFAAMNAFLFFKTVRDKQANYFDAESQRAAQQAGPEGVR